MQKLLENDLYIEDLFKTANNNFEWSLLKSKTILITGGTGLIGRYLIDLIMYKNINSNLNCNIICVSTNMSKVNEMFEEYLSNNCFKYIIKDVKEKFNVDDDVDFIIHAASNTSPIQYATDPVGTIETNTFGTYHLLKLSQEKNVKKFVFISSFEVYGNTNNVSEIGEHDFGIIDNTILRSCYPESKRLSESLCVSYSSQYGVDASIVRLARVFGPTMNFNSSLATAQFIKKALAGEDIVLKSDGSQLYSYNYVADAVMAILQVMVAGKNMEAYNVADKSFDTTLKNFASIVAGCVDKKIVFELPDEIEKKGFSNSVMTVMNGDKIKKIGWSVNNDLDSSISSTIKILQKK